MVRFQNVGGPNHRMGVGSHSKKGSQPVNISSEVLLGLMTAGGAVLAAAVGRLWFFFTAELTECKTDRRELHGKLDIMHGRIAEISVTVGRMQGQMDKDGES